MREIEIFNSKGESLGWTVYDSEYEDEVVQFFDFNHDEWHTELFKSGLTTKEKALEFIKSQNK